MNKTNVIDKKIAEKIAKILLSIKAITFRFDPPYTYTSGIISPIYTDNRIVMSYPKERNIIADCYVEIIKKHVGLKNVDYISGTATAAIPQASWVAQKLNLPMIYVRPSTKSYGKGNKMEGYLKKGARVLIVEDHISTATSVTNNAQTVRNSGGEVEYCITTTTYETKESQKALKDLGIKLIALTNGQYLLAEAIKIKLLSNSEKESVERWFKNPQTWQA